jgi:hypothetical protein
MFEPSYEFKNFLIYSSNPRLKNSRNDFLENVFLAQYQPDKKVTRSLLLNKISNKQVFNYKISYTRQNGEVLGKAFVCVWTS